MLWLRFASYGQLVLENDVQQQRDLSVMSVSLTPDLVSGTTQGVGPRQLPDFITLSDFSSSITVQGMVVTYEDVLRLIHLVEQTV